MFISKIRGGLLAPRHITAVLVGAVVLLSASAAWAGSGFRSGTVGGISIDAMGVVAQPNIEGQQLLRRELLKTLKKVPGELNQHIELRKISLKGLEAAIDDAVKNNLGVVPDEVKYLAGLQRIEYVLVYPEDNDIVLAGPGEGWKIDEKGNVVGVTTGRPVLLLDDLLIALRTADSARQVGISCSIDPTPEGRRAMRSFVSRQKQFNPAVIKGIEKTLGPQRITVTGVPADSHLARVLVACDYRMKRIAMKLDRSPVEGLPSFLDLIQSARRSASSMMPRWWLACDYEPLARSEDRLAWQIRGPGVKAVTEDDFIAADGSTTATGRKSPIAQKWADLMTAKYEELAEADKVFAELRSVMDMCVVAALLQKENLLAKAGCSLPLLTRTDSKMMTDIWNPPKTVATQCSFFKKGRNWIITASGGVQIESWQVAGKSEQDEQVQQVRTKASAPAEYTWWWN